MQKIGSLLVLAMAITTCGCATPLKSTLLGAGIGSAVGVGVGILAGSSGPPAQRTQGALIGAGIGGVLGALIGHASYKSPEQKDGASSFDVNSARLEMFGSATDKDKRPRLKPAQVRVRYVEDQIKDGLFIPAHFEYEIAQPAQWEPSK